MQIFLVSDSKTGINFFSELEDFLQKKIADADVDTIFVPFPEDVPAAVSNVLEEADLIFVFVLYEEMDYKVQTLLSKLVEADMQGKTKIVKVVEESDVGNLNEMQLEKEKEKLAKKWGQFIIDLLFKPEKFEPKETPASGFL